MDFAGADLTGAHLSDTVFLDCVDLDRAAGLDRVEHDGPSCLDRRTLSACAASLPDAFLAGIGYSGAEVQALRALSPGPRSRCRPASRAAEDLAGSV